MLNILILSIMGAVMLIATAYNIKDLKPIITEIKKETARTVALENTYGHYNKF